MLLAGYTLAATQAPTPTSSIEGVVVRIGTSEPISGVDVELVRIDDSEEYAAAAALASARYQQLSAGILPSPGPGVNLVCRIGPPAVHQCASITRSSALGKTTLAAFDC
jgi:hypothetical protein